MFQYIIIAKANIQYFKKYLNKIEIMCYLLKVVSTEAHTATF